MSRKRAAHFLLHRELALSPPNDAIVRSLLELGFEVDLFAPGPAFEVTEYGPAVRTGHVQYGYRWLASHALSRSWRDYDVFSGTSEDPLAISAVLSFIHRRPSFVLADEIKSGSYWGNARAQWKALCRWSIRQGRFAIVNDEARIGLLREYAGLPLTTPVLVYPSSFEQPPQPADRDGVRAEWGVPPDAFVVGACGGTSMETGADWLVSAVEKLPGMHAVMQPQRLDPFARYLLGHLACSDRLHVDSRPLGWQRTWAMAPAYDVGLAIYTNPGPQFGLMGISSNRLCMCLAMGVPVIASRQPSFEFLERFDCGVMVSSEDEFIEAIQYVRANAARMKANALRCAAEYIDAPGRRQKLKAAIAAVTGRT